MLAFAFSYTITLHGIEYVRSVVDLCIDIPHKGGLEIIYYDNNYSIGICSTML